MLSAAAWRFEAPCGAVAAQRRRRGSDAVSMADTALPASLLPLGASGGATHATHTAARANAAAERGGDGESARGDDGAAREHALGAAAACALGAVTAGAQDELETESSRAHGAAALAPERGAERHPCPLPD